MHSFTKIQGHFIGDVLIARDTMKRTKKTHLFSLADLGRSGSVAALSRICRLGAVSLCSTDCLLSPNCLLSIDRLLSMDCFLSTDRLLSTDCLLPIDCFLSGMDDVFSLDMEGSERLVERAG